MTYTDVTWIQLFGGWILAGLGIPLLAVLYWNCRSDLKHFLWVKKSQWPPEVYATMLRDQKEKLTSAIDKIKSLEAQLSRITDRPRDKSGRFEKIKGGEK